MLGAVEIFNSPLITFKTETTTTLVCTAWTYLLQAHCIENGREIRMLDSESGRRKYARNSYGEIKIVPLIELMKLCPDIVYGASFKNLEFLIGIRNRIQHHVGSEVDRFIAPKIQANILSFKTAISIVSKGLIVIDNDLPYALQFSEMSLQQTKQLLTSNAIPKALRTFILDFEGSLTPEIRQSSEYQARVKLQVVNKERGEDLEYVEVIGVGSNPPHGEATTYLKEVEKSKLTATNILDMMRDEGYVGFGMYQHTQLWKQKDGKNPKHGYGCQIANMWLWYENWVNEVVRPHCEKYYKP